MLMRLNSEVKIPTGDTIHNNIIKMFDNEKECIKEELQVLLLLFCNILFYYLIYFIFYYKFIENT